MGFRERPEYRIWRDAVVNLFGDKCILCGYAGNIHIHHVLPVDTYPELAFEASNGVPLCGNCHAKVSGQELEHAKSLQDLQQAVLNPLASQAETADYLPILVTSAAPWRDVFERAEAAYHGLDDTLEDSEEALRLYKEAVQLGSPEACLRIGCIYRTNEELQDSRQALAYLKEGASRGVAECYAEMAGVFAEKKQYDNAHKCWTKYFESEGFRSSAHDRGCYGFKYIAQAKAHGLPIKHKDILLQIRDEILRYAEEGLRFSRREQSERVSYFEDLLLFIRCFLYSEAERGPHFARGRIKQFNHDTGRGAIQQDSGDEDVCFHESEIIGWSVGSIEKGQEVDCNTREGKWTEAFNIVLHPA